MKQSIQATTYNQSASIIKQFVAPTTKPEKTPGYIGSILKMRCPRCRTGAMYKDNNPYKKFSLKHIFDMYDNCPVCNQKYELEPGFWYGTGYVSYALTVAISVATFIAWWVLIGFSTSDNRIFYWLGFNAFLLILLQPWIMRISRVIYIRFFVSYDPEWDEKQDTIAQPPNSSKLN